MSLLYTPNFKYPEGDLGKSQEFMDSSPHYHQQTYNQQHNNSGLTRFRSAPSSFLESLANGRNNHGSGDGNCEDFRYFRPSSPEIDTFLPKYMVMPNGSGDSGSHELQELGENAMKQEAAEYADGSSRMIYQNLSVHSFTNDNPVSVGNGIDNSFSVVTSMGLENSIQEKMASRNGSNLIRQNSSPAGLFSNLGVDNGFGMGRDVGCFRAGSGTNGETCTSTSSLGTRINFSSGLSSRFMPQIPEHGNQSFRTSSPEKSLGGNNGSSTQHMPNFTHDTWDNSSFRGIKRVQDDVNNIFFGVNASETQNGNLGNQPTRLIHHLSLPKTSAEMAAVEKFLHFQGSAPCKIRAKRGCATHPRSIAERVRRTRISERMRKLQDLFPNMDKQTNTADMLDVAVEYIKDLQKQVKTLTDNKAKCMCPSKQKQY